MVEQVIVLSIPCEARGARLDQHLSKEVATLSRSSLARMIESGRVTVDGQRVKPALRLKGGEKVRVEVPEPEPSTVAPEPIPLDILHEDSDIIVLNKPPGLVVHPGAGRRSGTLVNALLEHCESLPATGAPLRPGIVHRLDKETSGVMVVAKSDLAALSLASQFSKREVEKVYIGLVWGRIPDRSGVVDLPIGRSIRDRKKISVRTAKPREALTSYEVLRRFDGLTLLLLRMATGRTHQIRAHLTHLGHPLVGDKTYGRGSMWKRLESSRIREAVRALGRQALHARSLAFVHPRTGRRVSFEATLYPDMQGLIEVLETKEPEG